MTNYTITLGYQSSHSNEDAKNELLRVVTELRKQPQVLLNEVREYDPGVFSLGENVEEYTLVYATGKDLTLTVETQNTEERGCVVIRQLASGGDPGRSIKEACRRAFCRLVLQAMHKHGYEVSINVH